MLALWIVRSITTPLKQLIHTTEKIAAGNLTEEIAIHSKDEWGQLTASVNHMVHNLRDLIGGKSGKLSKSFTTSWIKPICSPSTRLSRLHVLENKEEGLRS
ncbi:MULTISPECIES: HAMP domain-containing protein [unclassified Paenibacillus]|uniref:HAMP domain-containing protein n=1 Tax=unclassified Paenibacillus TaxID=185978 RepID=UPI001FD76A36|nr:MULTISPECIES: HAMP domain-containing protein [unclassified Paenibacillus]